MDASIDVKGLIADSYAIDGIRVEECRSIFLDWALSLPEGLAPRAAILALLDRHAGKSPDHPMTLVLREGLDQPPTPRRRGGAASRRQ